MHWLEGQSLQPLLFGGDEADWKQEVFSEIDYSMRDACAILGLTPSEARGYMVRTARWKYLLWEGFPAQLFDLQADYAEQNDLANDPAHAEVLVEMRERLFRWFRQRKLRVTRTDARIIANSGLVSSETRGIYRGYWGPEGE